MKRVKKDRLVLDLRPLNEYDHIIVSLSGGKDSVAMLLDVMERCDAAGIPRDRIEAWHQDVDGSQEGEAFMDWPVTPSYCEALCRVLGVTLYFQWRIGGFEREMLREDCPTAPARFQLPDGTIGTVGGERGRGTRRKFPQVSADLTVRWCSAYLKIDVARRAIANDPRFRNKRVLYLSGERAEESAARSCYLPSEAHATNLAPVGKRPRFFRQVDHSRPILRWKEAEVWAVLERHRINPHPCYWLGFGRASCRFCIFGDAHQFATGKALAPQAFRKILDYETEFGVTIHRGETIAQRAARGQSYLIPAMAAALSETRAYPLENIMVPEGQWKLPPGAFKHCGGPS